ncbi:Ribokinase-like protein [Xylona heveae TC161]|uniref:Ribokinase-like protein n=1 Tax=Xylona heveae (strain CBS 132557 / TC161) TaxID=1328760 RepID=A0A165HES6_XYLHT|nr:Ribokinase-like protein [Xylona heveae TC161]KZF23402.1 Ribokinase-like protein [Xylona heveae TC161]
MMASQTTAKSTIDFCSLGMFIIDEIHFQPPIPSVYNIPGGAGSFAAIGARLLSPSPQSKTVGWIVDAGSDFPDEVYELIQRWDTACVFRETPERLTTRGWNGYGEGEKRGFKYLTPKLRLTHESLPPSHLLSKSFHLVCSPLRCIDLVTGILARRKQIASPEAAERPLFIWEPVSDLCSPEELPNCLKAIALVDCISSNLEEINGFWHGNIFSEHAQVQDIDQQQLDYQCSVLLEAGIGPKKNGSVVVRAGKDGCYVAHRGRRRWLPSYHQPDPVTGSNSRVVDPTGGGNSFLGALSVGLVRLQNVEEAAIWGSVAASFAIEQIGMPTLAYDENGTETWNGVQVQERLDEFKKRLETYVQP